MKKIISGCFLLLVFSTQSGAQSPANPPAAGLSPSELDFNAYRAHISGNQKDLDRWQSMGGEPARHARENPEAIYDAMSGDRAPAVLAYVLASGANPNVPRKDGRKGTPLHASGLDLDKIIMLVNAGTDINVRDEPGFTVLDHALISFGDEIKVPQYSSANQPVRVFKKLDVVRWLLAHGAGVNKQASDETGLDALQRTRREDKELIELLLQRGATLRGRSRSALDPPGKRLDVGSLTIAVLINRDDLALALLKRDGRIADNDDWALAAAARVGFSDVALALLAAGAKPDIADESGKVPLAWAQKRRDAALVAALNKAGAKPVPDEKKPALVGAPSFAQSVARIIDYVALMDSSRFYLTGVSSKNDPAFVIFGQGEKPYETMKCEQSATYRLVAFANEMGAIYVGVCQLEAKRLRGLVLDAREGMEKVFKQLSGIGSDSKITELRKPAGWEWKQGKLTDGEETFTFVVPMIGHGIIGLNTLVLFDKNTERATIVQGEINRLCEPEMNLRTPLCTDIYKAFTEIATRTTQLADGK